MTGRTSKSWPEVVGAIIGNLIADLLGAWALMRGLNDMGIHAGFTAAFLICVAASIVIGSGVRS
jgi:hypothetical protein